MFSGFWIIIVHGISALLLVLGVWIQTDITALIAIALFIVWDISFLISDTSLEHQDYDEILRRRAQSVEYNSYFLPFYGILLAALISVGPGRAETLEKLYLDVGMNPFWVVLPLISAAVAFLLFPIQMTTGSKDSPSWALKSLFGLSAFCQKVSIFIFTHVILRFLRSLVDHWYV